VFTFPAARIEGEALNQVCFDETGPSEETSVPVLYWATSTSLKNPTCPRIILTPSCH